MGLVTTVKSWLSPAEPAPAKSNFAVCLPKVLASEGGNDDDPRDPGGRTHEGIIQSEWLRWREDHPDEHLPADVWKAPQADVNAIYRVKYWNALQCDGLPAGVDYSIFDYGVNSGIGRAARVLQRILGVKVDGGIGPLTLAAAAKADPEHLINAINDERLAFLRHLPTWRTFGLGWNRRVVSVRKASLQMAAA